MFDRARRRMVEDQLAARGVSDSEVLRAMGKVPRHHFLDEALRHRAYDDCSLPIGSGQTISQPYTVALMTAALQLQPSERVLEIGTGSGYQTAVLAELCANVFTVERLAPLAVRARKILDSQKLFNIALQIGDGTIGWPAEAPFDAVVVTAGGPDLPRPLLAQLRRGGRLIVPVGQGANQSLVRFRVGENGIEEEVIADCRFVKLLGRYGFAN